ncbi:MAG: diguanylate cyclase [Clostridiales bacterium]|nr:diguanylate cyclase [Clostridiales bacterium]
MTSGIYEEAVRNSACAFAYHEAVFDENGRMIDYVFLDANPSFEEMTGLKKEQILHRRFVRDIARDKAHAREWVRRYEEMMIHGIPAEFEEYAEEFNRNYLVRAYVQGKGRFVTLFLNRTFEKKMQEIAQYFIDNMGERIDYDILVRFAHEVSGAQYAVLNLFEPDGRQFTTVALYGQSKAFEEATRLLGFDFSGKKWRYDPVREAKTKDQDITCFETLWDLTGDVIPEVLVRQLTKLLNVGQVVVAKVEKGGKRIGDFTLFFKKGCHLLNRDLVRLYLAQLGLFIEKTRLEQSLIASQKRFYILAEHAPIGFVACDPDGAITYANKRLLEILDSPSYEATRQINLLTYPPLQTTGFSGQLRTCLAEGRMIMHEMPYQSLWGKEGWLRVYLTPIRETGSVSGANIIVEDITENKKSEDELREKVYRDSLTGAYNRYALESILPDRLRMAGEKDRISCVAVVDVDDFKKINDTYGHRVGDSVLKHLASRVKRELRVEDLIIRTGGDEFLIYFHDIGNKKNAEMVVKRIFGKISARYRLGDGFQGKLLDLDVGCSIGTAFFPRDGATVETLTAKADEALYRVKNGGKADYHIKL